jgi:hypothetical protein
MRLPSNFWFGNIFIPQFEGTTKFIDNQFFLRAQHSFSIFVDLYLYPNKVGGQLLPSFPSIDSPTAISPFHFACTLIGVAMDGHSV